MLVEAEAEFIFPVLQHLVVVREAEETEIQVLRNQQLHQLILVAEAEVLDGCLVLHTQEEMAALE